MVGTPLGRAFARPLALPTLRFSCRAGTVTNATIWYGSVLRSSASPRPTRCIGARDTSFASHRAVAAVRHHDRAGDVTRQIGGEEDRGADDVLRLARAAERRVLHEQSHRLRIVGARGGVQRRLDKARA